MSHEEQFAWLFQHATGWLGWNPGEALAAPIPMIEAAIEGRVELLQAIFGGGKTKPKATHPLTPAAFDVVFAKQRSK